MFFCPCKEKNCPRKYAKGREIFLRKLGSLAAITFALLCLGSELEARATTAADLQPAVCRVHNRLDGSSNIGSGTLIDRTSDSREGLVLTCAHLFHEGVGDIVVTFSDGRTHGAKLIHVDRQADLAALAIANPKAKPAKVSLVVSQQGRLFACGYGPRGVYRCAVGPRIGQASGTGQLSLMIADRVRSGDSGGGVFDEQGRLVAVIWGESQGVTYASYGKPLQRFLGRVLGQRNLPVGNCPGGVCPQQPPTILTPRPQRPLDPGAGEHSIVVDPRWDQLSERVDRLEKEKQDRGNYLTRADLNGVLYSDDLSGYARAEDLKKVENDGRQSRASLLDRIGTLAQASGAGVGRAAGKAAVGFLGLSGPAGWGILAATTLGGWFLGRRMKRKTNDAGGRRRRPFPG